MLNEGSIGVLEPPFWWQKSGFKEDSYRYLSYKAILIINDPLFDTQD